MTRGLLHRCPNCGGNTLFGRWLRMNRTCTRCGLKFEREDGFFLGALVFDYTLIAVLTLFPVLILVFTGVLSMWTALIERSDEAITLELINGDPDERSEIPLRIQINPVSHRVTSEFIPGSTALAALQPAIHQCRTASWMLEELQELFARGKDLPLP